MKKSNQNQFMISLLLIILGGLLITIGSSNIDDKWNIEVKRVLDEGYTSDEIVIMKSISPEFNYYELYIPEYTNDGRICVIQNINDEEFIIINQYLDTDPNVAR